MPKNQFSTAWRWSLCNVLLGIGAIMSTVAIEQMLSFVPPMPYHLARILVVAIYALQASRHALFGRKWPKVSVLLLSPVCLFFAFADHGWLINSIMMTVAVLSWLGGWLLIKDLGRRSSHANSPD
jgi:hypothetical protein